MNLKVTQEDIACQKDLVDTGDINLTERRKVFSNKIGRTTSLTDDQLLIALAATDDDDDSAFCDNVVEVEQGRYEIVTAQAPVA